MHFTSLPLLYTKMSNYTSAYINLQFGQTGGSGQKPGSLTFLTRSLFKGIIAAMHKPTTLDLNPFFFQGNETGCLLVHGFTGSPPEMWGMGAYLAQRGLTVLGVRLAGHGTTPEEMARTGWHDWLASAEDGLRQLRKQCQRVFVVGFSMGGLLGLHLAVQHHMTGLVVIASPTHLEGGWQLPLVPVAKYLVRWYVPGDKMDRSDPAALDRMWSYDRVPTACIHELMRLMRQVRKELPRVTTPILVMQGERDQVVPLDSAQEIFDRVGSADKELVWFERSGHGIVEDIEREEVWRQVYGFIAARFSGLR